MKGVILAGGTGSRLQPMTLVTNKHLLPVGGCPMIYYSINQLVEAGIEDIMIITGTEHMGDMIKLLGSGKNFGCKFTYRVQDEAGGIAQALGLVEGFSRGESIAVLLGDNIFEDSLAPAINSHEEFGGACIFLKEVPDPQRFGVAEVKENKIISIEEKPQIPRSNLAITGFYLYDPQVYEIIVQLQPSLRGELEISDVNREYLKKEKLNYQILHGWWTDAGTPESYKKANQLVWEGK